MLNRKSNSWAKLEDDIKQEEKNHSSLLHETKESFVICIGVATIGFICIMFDVYMGGVP